MKTPTKSPIPNAIPKPKIILFDYGQTLVNEKQFDSLAGTKALLEHATANRHNHTAEEVDAVAASINHEIGRDDPKYRHLQTIEIPNHMFTSYLYHALGIELDLSEQEIDRIFWDAASPGVPTNGIEDLLDFLHENGIRTGVISNIPYCGEVVEERINRLIPNNHFEFIIATSEYMFRKPNPRIFHLALEKANLSPNDVWYAGDNPKADVQGSRNAGLHPIWYLGATTIPQPDTPEQNDILTIHHWNELKAILSKWSTVQGD